MYIQAYLKRESIFFRGMKMGFIKKKKGTEFFFFCFCFIKQEAFLILNFLKSKTLIRTCPMRLDPISLFYFSMQRRTKKKKKEKLKMKKKKEKLENIKKKGFSLFFLSSSTNSVDFLVQMISSPFFFVTPSSTTSSSFSFDFSYSKKKKAE